MVRAEEFQKKSQAVARNQFLNLRSNLQRAYITRTSDTEVADRIVRRILHHSPGMRVGRGILGFGLVQPPQPEELQDLLGREEAGDEVGLWGEKGEVCVVNVFHVGAGEHPILLHAKIDGKGKGREPPGGGEVDTHFDVFREGFWTEFDTEY